MEINVIPLGYIQANCYLLSTEKSAIVIDPGFESEIVTDFLKNSNNKEKLILLTHAHFDHIGGAVQLRKDTNTKIAICEYDNYALSDPIFNLATTFQTELKPFSADILLKDSEEFNVGDITFKVIHTPGHTVGSACFLVKNFLFSGDTLFSGSIGRTDFYGGNYATLVNSIKSLYNSLPLDTVVLSGHGEETTIGTEMAENPFIRG